MLGNLPHSGDFSRGVSGHCCFCGKHQKKCWGHKKSFLANSNPRCFPPKKAKCDSAFPGTGWEKHIIYFHFETADTSSMYCVKASFAWHVTGGM